MISHPVCQILFFRVNQWIQPTLCKRGRDTGANSSLVAQMVKCLPAIQETRVWSLGWEDPLEKEMATHSSTLAWKIPWMEETDRLQSTGSQSQTWLRDFTFSFTYRCEYQEVRLTGGHLSVCLAQWHYTISDLRLTNKNLKSSLTEKKISFTQVVSKTF